MTYIKACKGKALYAFDNGSILWYHKLHFYIDNKLVCSIPSKKSMRIASRIRILSRLLRLEPRCIERLNNSQFVVCILHKLWLLDIDTSSIKILAENRKGWSDPLNLCSDGEKVYWGDYGANPNLDYVNIYSIDNALSINVVYKFPVRHIRHIHNIIWDKHNSQFYIFTGDLEDTAGIYKANSNWTDIRPIRTGSQQYRAVVGFATPKGLIYTTDAVDSKNNIYYLSHEGIRAISSFPGSCIYGTENDNYYFFSSTVEPKEGRGLLNLFDYRLGEGIKDYNSYIIAVRKADLKVKEVCRFKKDIFPMKLFQYGTVMFPKGQLRNDLLAYIMACRCDGNSIRFEDI